MLLSQVPRPPYSFTIYGDNQIEVLQTQLDCHRKPKWQKEVINILKMVMTFICKITPALPLPASGR
jgi:hypothetical protein